MAESLRVSKDNLGGDFETAPTTVASTILGRRSVRFGFSDTEIPQVVIEEIIDCGLSAPSSKNAKPWSLHVVRSREILGDIADDMIADDQRQTFVPHNPVTGLPIEKYVSTVDESAEVLRQVPMAIFLENRGEFSMNRATVASGNDEVQKEALIGMGLEYVGLGACIENIWLAAEARGVKGAFMGDLIISEVYIKQRLSMVGDLVGAIALGYSDVEIHDKPISRENVVWH